MVEPTLPNNRASGEQEREGGIEVVDSGAERDNHSRAEDPRPAQRAKRLSRFRKIKPEAGHPDGQSKRMHRQNLLAEECQWGERNIAATAADVGLQLEEGKVTPDVPQQIRQEDQTDNHRRE